MKFMSINFNVKLSSTEYVQNSWILSPSYYKNFLTIQLNIFASCVPIKCHPFLFYKFRRWQIKRFCACMKCLFFIMVSLAGHLFAPLLIFLGLFFGFSPLFSFFIIWRSLVVAQNVEKCQKCSNCTRYLVDCIRGKNP